MRCRFSFKQARTRNVSGTASLQRVVASGAQAACSSGVPWKGFKDCGPGSFLSSAAKAVAPRICNKTMNAQVLAYEVLAYIVSGPIFVHGFGQLRQCFHVPLRDRICSVVIVSILDGRRIKLLHRVGLRSLWA